MFQYKTMNYLYNTILPIANYLIRVDRIKRKAHAKLSEYRLKRMIVNIRNIITCPVLASVKLI